jgi:PAS domain S-box-containing protein
VNRGHTRTLAELSEAVLDAAGCLVIVTEVATGAIVGMNTPAETLMGYPRAQIIGLPLWEIVAPAQRAMIQRAFRLPAGAGVPATFESNVNLRSGHPRRVSWSSAFLRDATDVPTHVVITGIDISATASEGGLFSHLIAAANSVPMLSTDRRGRVTYCSLAAERLLGLKSSDLIGSPLPLEIFDPTQLAQRAATYDAPDGLGLLTMPAERLGLPTTDDHTVQIQDWTLVHKDGSRVIASVVVSEALDSTGRLVGYVAVGRDVTEDRSAVTVLAAALEREASAAERMRDLDRAKSDFVSTVSHELRTPTTNIVGPTELLQDGLAGELNAAQLQLVDSIGRNSARLITLADDLLVLAAVDAGDLRLDERDIDLCEVVACARDKAAPLLLDRSLDVVLDLPSSPVVVRGDATHLVRMLGNLFSNAVKFTDDGGTITLLVSESPDGAVIEISDTGVGIPALEQEDLFTRFFRSSSSRERASQGTGLGLSIVASIVHRHRGEISVRSEHLKGSTFTVRLPLAG